CVQPSLFGFVFLSSRRRHTSFSRDWSSDVCSSDLAPHALLVPAHVAAVGQKAQRHEELEGAIGHAHAERGAAREPPSARRLRCRSEERRVGKVWRSRRAPHAQTETYRAW